VGQFHGALKLLGFIAPFAYAAATFTCFHYPDNKVSDDAKAATSRRLQPKEYGGDRPHSRRNL
jgi:hypothetical protein